MAWTEDRIETLKILWAEGLSASQIADKLGGVTRNGVIGKVNRLGLSKKTTTPRTKPSPHHMGLPTKNLGEKVRKNGVVMSKKPERKQPKPTEKTIVGMMSLDSIVLQVKELVGQGITDAGKIILELGITDTQLAHACETGKIKRVKLPQRKQWEELNIPFNERASILTLTETRCRWPINFPREKDFHFCGRECDREISYCDYHANIAYQPVQTRRKSKR